MENQETIEDVIKFDSLKIPIKQTWPDLPKYENNVRKIQQRI